MTPKWNPRVLFRSPAHSSGVADALAEDRLERVPAPSRLLHRNGGSPLEMVFAVLANAFNIALTGDSSRSVIPYVAWLRRRSRQSSWPLLTRRAGWIHAVPS